MLRLSLFLLLIALASAPLGAQGRDAFAQPLVDFINALTEGRESTALVPMLDAMTAGLAEWDAAIARAEAGMAADIGKAPPAIAARMRAALGLLYLERGRANDALAQLDRAASAPDAPFELHLFRGWALRAAGRPVDAAAAFARAFETNPRDPMSAYLFLHQHRVAARPENAATRRAATVIHDVEPALYGLEQGTAPFTVPALLDDGASAEPILPPARYAEGFALLQKGRYAEAIAAWRKAAAAPSAADIDDAMTRGRELLARGSEREALEEFEAAAQRRPIVGAAALHRLIGQLRENHFDGDGAIAAFTRAIDINPNDAAAHRELAEALQGLDRLAAARVEFVVSLRLDPRNAVAWTGLGQVHVAEARLEPALRAFARAVALDPRSREARYALARTLIRIGRVDEGQRELEAYERLQADAMEEERRRYEENLRRIEGQR